MIHLDPTQLRLVKSLVGVVAPHASAWVFGSRSTGIHLKKFSDLDIVLKANDVDGLIDTEALKSHFSASDLPYMVDVLDWNTLDDEFRELITPQLQTLI